MKSMNKIFKTEELVVVGKAPICNLCNDFMIAVNDMNILIGFKCKSCGLELRFDN